MNIKSLLIVVGLSIICSTKADEIDRVYTVTAYCACKKCCGPNAKGITASGKSVKEGVTIAAPRSIPFGTKLFIEGVGIRIVQDRLAKRYDDRIDVFIADHNRALNFGKKTLKVKKL